MDFGHRYLFICFIPFDLQCLFRTPLNNYDAVILLHRNKLPYPQRLLFPAEMNQGMVYLIHYPWAHHGYLIIRYKLSNLCT